MYTYMCTFEKINKESSEDFKRNLKRFPRDVVRCVTRA